MIFSSIVSCIYTGDFYASNFLVKMDVANLHIISNGSHGVVTLLSKMTVSSCLHSDGDILNLFKAKSELISLRFFIAAPILY